MVRGDAIGFLPIHPIREGARAPRPAVAPAPGWPVASFLSHNRRRRGRARTRRRRRRRRKASSLGLPRAGVAAGGVSARRLTRVRRSHPSVLGAAAPVRRPQRARRRPARRRPRRRRRRTRQRWRGRRSRAKRASPRRRRRRRKRKRPRTDRCVWCVWLVPLVSSLAGGGIASTAAAGIAWILARPSDRSAMPSVRVQNPIDQTLHCLEWHARRGLYTL